MSFFFLPWSFPISHCLPQIIFTRIIPILLQNWKPKIFNSLPKCVKDSMLRYWGWGGDIATKLMHHCSLLIIAKTKNWILSSLVIHQILTFTLCAFREDEVAIGKRESLSILTTLHSKSTHLFSCFYLIQMENKMEVQSNNEIVDRKTEPEIPGENHNQTTSQVSHDHNSVLSGSKCTMM